MTEADLNEIIEACKPTPAMFLSGGIPIGGSPQENANAAWAKLGARMGFDPMTVNPSTHGGARCFTAVPSETPEQRDLRLKLEAQEAREKEINELEDQILGLQQRLDGRQHETGGAA